MFLLDKQNIVRMYLDGICIYLKTKHFVNCLLLYFKTKLQKWMSWPHPWYVFNCTESLKSNHYNLTGSLFYMHKYEITCICLCYNPVDFRLNKLYRLHMLITLNNIFTQTYCVIYVPKQGVTIFSFPFVVLGFTEKLKETKPTGHFHVYIQLLRLFKYNRELFQSYIIKKSSVSLNKLHYFPV